MNYKEIAEWMGMQGHNCMGMTTFLLIGLKEKSNPVCLKRSEMLTKFNIDMVYY
jgi:hypothetical protein